MGLNEVFQMIHHVLHSLQEAYHYFEKTYATLLFNFLIKMIKATCRMHFTAMKFIFMKKFNNLHKAKCIKGIKNFAYT